jgi:hypothetical protein
MRTTTLASRQAGLVRAMKMNVSCVSGADSGCTGSKRKKPSPKDAAAGNERNYDARKARQALRQAAKPAPIRGHCFYCCYVWVTKRQQVPDVEPRTAIGATYAPHDCPGKASNGTQNCPHVRLQCSGLPERCAEPLAQRGEAERLGVASEERGFLATAAKSGYKKRREKVLNQYKRQCCGC